MPRRIADNPSFRRHVSLDQLAWEPQLAATLTPGERRRVLRACSAILSALAMGTETVPPTLSDGYGNAGDDELLTPEQAAQRLGIQLGTLYERLAPLDESHGVIRVGRKCTRIRWQLFLGKASGPRDCMAACDVARSDVASRVYPIRLEVGGGCNPADCPSDRPKRKVVDVALRKITDPEGSDNLTTYCVGGRSN